MKMKRYVYALICVLLCTVLCACGENPERAYKEGNAYLETEDYQAAMEAFKEVMRTEPEQPEGYLGLAQAYSGLGETTKAIEVLARGWAATQDERIRQEQEDLFDTSILQVMQLREQGHLTSALALLRAWADTQTMGERVQEELEAYWQEVYVDFTFSPDPAMAETAFLSDMPDDSCDGKCLMGLVLSDTKNSWQETVAVLEVPYFEADIVGLPDKDDCHLEGQKDDTILFSVDNALGGSYASSYLYNILTDTLCPLNEDLSLWTVTDHFIVGEHQAMAVGYPGTYYVYDWAGGQLDCQMAFVGIVLRGDDILYAVADREMEPENYCVHKRHYDGSSDTILYTVKAGPGSYIVLTEDAIQWTDANGTYSVLWEEVAGAGTGA